jgi:hypothetical protein
VKAKLIGDFGGVHCVLYKRSMKVSNTMPSTNQKTYRQILLIGKNQQKRIPKFILVQHPLQFLTGLNHTIAIIAINNEDNALGILEVMPPKRSDLVLPTDIPHGELDVLVFDSLDVKAYAT